MTQLNDREVRACAYRVVDEIETKAQKIQKREPYLPWEDCLAIAMVELAKC